MYNVTSCPNKVDVLKRSKAINCTEKNPYMCLPNKDLTELLEICHHEPFRGSSPGEKTDATLLHNVHIFHGCLTSTIFILHAVYWYVASKQVYVFIWTHGTTLVLVFTDANILWKAVQLHGMNHCHVSFTKLILVW